MSKKEFLLKVQDLEKSVRKLYDDYLELRVRQARIHAFYKAMLSVKGQDGKRKIAKMALNEYRSNLDIAKHIIDEFREAAKVEGIRT